jgi:multidrug efflux system outer membrane protein
VGLLDQGAPPTAVGATSALLQRRPDILAAEQRMIQANAEVGVAIANKFPRIGISALLGGVDAHVDGNWSGFGVWNAAVTAAGPIFTGGRLRSVEEERRAHFQETVAEYRKTVLVAFQDTSNALAAQDALARQRLALESQVAALRRSSGFAFTRYDEGRASYFEVLEAQQQLLPAENALARTQRDQLLAVVDLYKALGGGWNTTAAQAAPPST